MLIEPGRLRPRREHGDETGSVIVALLVVVVVAMGLVAIFANVNSSFNLTRTDQNRTNAFQLANAGMDQALYRIDTKTLPLTASGTYEPIFDADSIYAGFRESLTVGTSVFHIEALKDPPRQDTTWKVRATGTDQSGRKRQVVATVGAESLFPDAFFTVNDFELTGNQDSPIAYRSSVCLDPRGRTDSPCIPTLPLPARLGTNGVISGSAATADSFKERWAGFNMYGRTNQADADAACMEGACGTSPKVAAITDRRTISVPAATGGPCPNGGNIGANGTITTIPAGDYTCESVNLRGTIVVGGTGTVRIWPTKNFAVAPGAVVNEAQAPARFQVYFPEQSPAASGSICDAKIWGLLYTPGLHIDCNGSHQPEIFGAVVANIHAGTGNHFAFHWDMDAVYATSTGRYVIRDWRECPADQTDC